jgi:hypothetical protein
MRIFLLNLIRNLIRGFADHNKVKFDCPHRLFVGGKSLKIHAFREGLNFRNRFQNILQPFAPDSRRHEHFPPARAHGCAV